jgi:hypothetical protein
MYIYKDWKVHYPAFYPPFYDYGVLWLKSPSYPCIYTLFYFIYPIEDIAIPPLPTRGGNYTASNYTITQSASNYTITQPAIAQSHSQQLHNHTASNYTITQRDQQSLFTN